MILGGHQQTTARPSLIVTGPAAAGETTALLHVGRACHLAHTRKNPTPPGSAHVTAPVAYVLVPPGATAKTLITRIRPLPRHPHHHPHDPDPDHRRRLPHLHPSGRPTRPHRRNAPPQPPHHHRRPNRRPDQRPHRTPPRDPRLRRHQRHRHPPVHRHPRCPARRPRHPRRLRIPHRLIRQAAITAIGDGTERITKTALDAVRLDHFAEQHTASANPHPTDQAKQL